MRSRAFAVALSLALALTVAFAVGASPALADTHPFLGPFGSFADPNGIAVDESSGDVYVADIASGTVQRFDASGNPVAFGFPAGSKEVPGNTLKGADTPAESFSFPEAPDNPAALAVDNSTSPADPSAGDLYVVDAGHGVIDKFNVSGEYLGQIGPTAPIGIGIDASGNVRVLRASSGRLIIDVYDNSVANYYVRTLETPEGYDGVIGQPPEPAFAVGSTGDVYPLFGSCGCIEKLGPRNAYLGRVDEKLTDAAVAIDQATGHVYIDDQSSVSEWDTGEMNGLGEGEEPSSAGTLVSTFGSLQLSGSPGHGGIAVNSVTGNIYVANPSEGNVLVFSTEGPAVVVGAAANLTQTTATLNGAVNPRGAAVNSCQFEYGTSSTYGHSAPCEPGAGQIGSGTSPVPVSANISGLQPGLLYHFRLSVVTSAGGGFSTGRLASAGPGFGVDNFEIAFTNSDGTPDTQAGSHPYQMATTIEFDTTFLPFEPVDSRYQHEPDGNFKDVIVTLPPGLVGDPNATEAKCTLAQLAPNTDNPQCPASSFVGYLEAELGENPAGANIHQREPVFNMVPPHGVAVQFGAHFVIPNAIINVRVKPGGDYGVTATSENAPVTVPVISTRLVLFGTPPNNVSSHKPLLTLPTACNGPLKATVSADSYQNPGATNPDGSPNLSDPSWKTESTVTRRSDGSPGGMTGCAQLQFPPTITAAPDVPDASTATGLNVGVHVSQTAALNPSGLAESALRNTTVELPAGVAINPAGADGLEACSEGLAGFTGLTAVNPEFEPGDLTPTFTPISPEQLQPGVSFCPDGAKIGTVSIKSPLLENPLKGSVYLAAQDENPFKSLIAMYLIAEDEVSGTLIKLAGEVQLCERAGEVIEGATCQVPGQIVTTFKNTPELPFEDLELHFFGGERAPLVTPDHCGSYSADATFTPWDGNGAVNTSSPPFQITSGPNGGPCPSGPLPFAPSLTAGSTNTEAGAFSPFTMTMSREDGQQNLQSVQLHMPPGLSGMLTGVELCPEPQASEGTCGPNSLIGETTVSVGTGGHPFAVKGGKVYLTGPYEGAPFGLSIVNPAKAGPFDLEHTAKNHPACDCVLVRAKIEVDPTTAALTVTTDPGQFKIPTILEGIPLQIRHVNVTITRPGFTFNPTNCNKLEIGGALTSAEGASSSLSVPFQSTSCTALKFAPKFSASTSGKTSKANGASLSVKLTYPKAPFGSQANIHSVKVELPKQLPSRLTTLQKACLDSVFNANPATCPAASVVGHATAITPILPVPLTGPAYFVSHGGAKFPELIIVLQGYGVTVQLHGETFISKAGVTSSTFHAVPDVPVTSFELTLPQGRFSALAANTNLCAATKTVTVKKRVTIHRHGHTRRVLRSVKQKVPAPLVMPTTFTAQNGAVITQSTKIAITGCGKAKKTKKHSKATRHRKRRK